MKKIKLIGVIILLASLSMTSFGAEKQWLLGEWELSKGPEGITKDRLIFQKKGKFTKTQISTGKEIHGTYSVGPGLIKVELLNQGKDVKNMDLIFDGTGAKLFYKSTKTGKTSHYKKLD